VKWKAGILFTGLGLIALALISPIIVEFGMPVLIGGGVIAAVGGYLMVKS